jgi:hypothetical protein
MRLTAEWKSTVTQEGETATFYFRNPTNKELSDFLDDRYELGRKGKVSDHTLAARSEFFDKLLKRVENLEGEDGTPITGPDRAADIPVNWKGNIIFRHFEDIEVDEKN